MSWTCVITGTRDGRADVWEALDLYRALFGDPYLVLGGDLNDGRASQRGVDLQAYQWARARGVHGIIELAFWDAGNAGPPRNTRMVRHAPAGHHLLAFPAVRSRGTWDCFRKGQKARLLAVVVEAGWAEQLTTMHRERWTA